MGLINRKLNIYFLISFFVFITFNINIFPSFLIYIFYRKSREASLWFSYFIGLIFDLLSSGPFGVFTFAYTLTTLALYEQKRNFFLDSLSTYPFLAGLYTAALQIATYLFFFLFTDTSRVSFWKFFILPSLLQMMYAFFCYTLPEKGKHVVKTQSEVI